MLLRAPNGVLVDASETATPNLLAEGWRPVVRPDEPGEPVDLATLTVATLRALCEERGIEAPKKATKAKIIELLTE